MVDINFVLTVLIQVICVFIFLTVFFFTYAAKKEGEILTDQVNFIIRNLAGIHTNSLPEGLRKTVLDKINAINTDTPEIRDQTKQIEETNKKIQDKTTKILIILAVIVILITAGSYLLRNKVNYFKGIHLSKILKETVIILTFVAITEFVFFKYFGAKFISVDPNTVKGNIFKKLAETI